LVIERESEIEDFTRVRKKKSDEGTMIRTITTDAALFVEDIEKGGVWQGKLLLELLGNRRGEEGGKEGFHWVRELFDGSSGCRLSFQNISVQISA
jgi:hypothetical protein